MAASPAVLSGGEGVGETGCGVGGMLVGSAGGGVASNERREAAELRCSGEDACRRGGVSG